MMPKRFALAVAVICALAALPIARAQNPVNVESAFQKFWAAHSPIEAARLVDDIVKTGVTFDDTWQRLKTGRTYTAQKTGIIQLSNKTEDGIEHFFFVNVPSGYDPTRGYQVRFQLHGGVGGRTDNKLRGNGAIGALAGAEQFYVLPAAWNDAPWWSEDQVLNMSAIVDALKRTYNIDENRVVVSGVSDGGTGAYYLAMRETTPFASFLPLNGFIMVLAGGDIEAVGLYPDNLRNKPMFVVNGGRDRLYPTSIVEPFTNHLTEGGVDIEYHPQPDGEHNTAWWPEVKDPFEQFAKDHPRDPHPDKLTWETASLAHNRDHWLAIDELGAGRGDAKDMPDLNVISDDALGETFGAISFPMFSRRKPSGRVDLVRTGNTIEATTKGVAAFTLLLSPDRIDFNQPVKVVSNGRVVFDGRVERSIRTLLKWAARDNDRTMLYAAELKIKL